MAQKQVTVNTATAENDKVQKPKGFGAKYSKAVIFIGSIIILFGGAFLGYKYLYKAPREQKAKDLAVKAQQAAQATYTPQKAYAQSGNYYKDFIYQKESGNNPNAVNSIGCRGIGQACPGTKLPCGADYACQDAWFTNYAMTRYGSWEKAYNFWVANRWW